MCLKGEAGFVAVNSGCRPNPAGVGTRHQRGERAKRWRWRLETGMKTARRTRPVIIQSSESSSRHWFIASASGFHSSSRSLTVVVLCYLLAIRDRPSREYRGEGTPLWTRHLSTSSTTPGLTALSKTFLKKERTYLFIISNVGKTLLGICLHFHLKVNTVSFLILSSVTTKHQHVY